MDCYIPHTVLLLRFIIATICYHYVKHSPNKKSCCYTNIKMESNALKKFSINSCYYLVT